MLADKPKTAKSTLIGAFSAVKNKINYNTKGILFSEGAFSLPGLNPVLVTSVGETKP